MTFLLADLCFIKIKYIKKIQKKQILTKSIMPNLCQVYAFGPIIYFQAQFPKAFCLDTRACALVGSVRKASRPIGYRTTQKTDHIRKGVSYLTHLDRPVRGTGSEVSAHTKGGRYFRASIGMIINYLSLGEFINRGERFRTVWQTGLLGTSFAQVSDHLPCLVHHTRTTDSPLEYCEFPHPSRLPPNSYAK